MFGLTMVAKTNLKSNSSILEVRTREEILRFLYDEKERSAYKIAKEICMATATVIGHLNKLEEVGSIRSRDATKGNLRRRYYRITEKGKRSLLVFLKEYAYDIKKNKEIAKTFVSFFGNKNI